VHEWRWLMGENAPNRSFDSMSKGWLLVMAIIVVPVYFLVARLADDGKTLVASCSAGMIVVVGYFWDLRKRVWFWITVTFIAFLHVLFVVLLPQPAKQWNMFIGTMFKCCPLDF